MTRISTCSNTKLAKFRGTDLEAYWRQFDYDNFNVEDSGPGWRLYCRPVRCRFCGKWAYKYCLEWKVNEGLDLAERFECTCEIFSHKLDHEFQFCTGRRTIEGGALTSLEVYTRKVPIKPALSPYLTTVSSSVAGTTTRLYYTI